MSQIFAHNSLKTKEYFDLKDVTYFKNPFELMKQDIQGSFYLFTANYLKKLDTHTTSDIENNNIVFCQLADEKSKSRFRIEDLKKTEGTFDGYVEAGFYKLENISALEKLLNRDLDSFEYYFLPYFHEAPKKKIVFLDRDDVLIKDTGYPHKVGELIFNTEILELLKYYQSNNFEFIVVTNQSGIGRGFYKVEDYEKCKTAINEFFEGHGINFLDWFYCPYHPEAQHPFNKESIYRKPSAGMIELAQNKYHIDVTASVMIGDKPSDRILKPGLKSHIISQNAGADFQNFNQLLATYKK